MKFSLLVPTRGRPERLAAFVESVYTQTTHKKNIEILFAADEDDIESQNNVRAIMAKFERQIEMSLHTRPQSEMLNNDYYNWLGDFATGDMIWILADDLLLIQPDWDTVVTREVESFFNAHPDRVVCVSIRDNTPPPSHRLPKFPCFPMFSREAKDACKGWYLHPKVPTWGADYVSYCIYQPIGRLLEIQDRNYLNHISWHTKQCDVDATNHRIGAIFNRLKGVWHHNTDRILAEEVPNIRNEVMDYINAFYKKES